MARCVAPYIVDQDLPSTIGQKVSKPDYSTSSTPDMTRLAEARGMRKMYFTKDLKRIFLLGDLVHPEITEEKLEKVFQPLPGHY